jgi:hypothetical protein
LKLLVALENNVEGRSLAWALEFPGCFAYGADPPSALVVLPEAFRGYFEWIQSHSPAETLPFPEGVEVDLVESWDVYAIDGGFNVAPQGEYDVNAWFRHDWVPLSEGEVQRASRLLAWSREDLLAAVQGLSGASLQAERTGERWSIASILKHVGGAEWWYLDRLGLAFPRQEVLDDPFQRLERVRLRLLEVLPSLIGSRQVVGVDGEFWSPRKLVRRLVWHERDHTAHILGLKIRYN